MSSIAQAKKDALIANLVEARKNILNAASALPARQRDEIFLGSWSVKDLLAHLIGWDYTNHRPHSSSELDDERVHHQQIVEFGG